MKNEEAARLSGRSQSWLKSHTCGWCGQTIMKALRGYCGDTGKMCDGTQWYRRRSDDSDEHRAIED